MIEKAINRILSLAKPTLVEVNGFDYSTEKIYRVEKELHAKPLVVKTLTSLVDYVKNFQETWKGEPLLVHVASPMRVVLTGALDEDREREELMVVEAETPYIPFEKFIENEKMLITVQSMFVDDAATDRAAVLRFAGKVTSGSIRDYSDDGVTQQATIKVGVVSKDQKLVPSPCVLRPYRTFIEVEQPASKFIFRMREVREGCVESALIEADGGAWRLEAMRNISAFLQEELEGTGVTVIA